MTSTRDCKIAGMTIIIAAGMAVWFFYNRLLRKHGGDSFEGTLFKFPDSMKCLFPNVSFKEKKNICQDADFDGWSVLHVILYFVMGVFFPGEYWLVLGISVFSEAWEYMSGWRARWIVDPVVNMVSYWIGSQLSYRFGRDYCALQERIPGRWVFIALVALCVFVVINNPDFIGLQD